MSQQNGMNAKNNKLVQHGKYVAGWLDSSIHDFLDAFTPSASTAFALVACLDSNLEPASLLQTWPALQGVKSKVKPLGQALLLPAKELQEIRAQNELYLGFDEVWFFPTGDIKAKPQSSWIVGPRRIDEAKLRELGDWMSANGCSLALGDGDGLNVIVKAQGLVKYLIGHSLSQPEPAMPTTAVVDEERAVSAS